MTGDEGRDAGSEVQRVQDALRTRLGNGTYRVGERVASQAQLAEEFGVSRDTVQKAMRELVEEGWFRTRKGSGTTVVRAQVVHSPGAMAPAPGVGLGQLLHQAFEEPEIVLDVFSLSSESFDLHIRLQALRVQAGEVGPERIVVRMLLPADDVPLGFPRRYDGEPDPRLTDRMHAIIRRHSASARDALVALQDQGLVGEVDVQIRSVPVTPTSKVYLINRTQALHGFYELVRRPIRVAAADGTDELVDAIDVLGIGSTLLHYARGPEAPAIGRHFIDAAQKWFDSHWEHLGDPGTAE